MTVHFQEWGKSSAAKEVIIDEKVSSSARHQRPMPFAADATWPCYCHPVMDRACSTPKWENLKKTPKSEIESYNFYESNFRGGI